MSLKSDRIEFTTALGKLLRWAWAHDLYVAMDWVKRDVETQTRMVNAGLSKTMKSLHLNALAVDLLLFYLDGTTYQYISDGNHPGYKKLGERWEDLGGVWGGRWEFKDSGHFQWRKT